MCSDAYYSRHDGYSNDFRHFRQVWLITRMN